VSQNEGHERRDRPTRHRFWSGIVLGGLLGAAAGAALVGTAAVSASPFLAAAAFHRPFARGGHLDPERARAHAEFATAFVLERLDATEAQRTEAKRIVSEALDELLPLAAAHRENREAIREELTRSEIDPEAIERLRQSEMELFEIGSKKLSEAVIAVARTLDEGQRAELAEMARELRH
jgi:hypothetical protein